MKMKSSPKIFSIIRSYVNPECKCRQDSNFCHEFYPLNQTAKLEECNGGLCKRVNFIGNVYRYGTGMVSNLLNL